MNVPDVLSVALVLPFTVAQVGIVIVRLEMVEHAVVAVTPPVASACTHRDPEPVRSVKWMVVD